MSRVGLIKEACCYMNQVSELGVSVCMGELLSMRCVRNVSQNDLNNLIILAAN